MNHSDTLTDMQQTPTRRRALVLVAALAVTLGAVTAPLAGTAHAGGSKPSIINTSNVDLAGGSKPGTGSGLAAAVDTDFDLAGTSKPGVIN